MGWVISGAIILLGFVSGVMNGRVGGDDAGLICTFWGVAGVIWGMLLKYCIEKKKEPANDRKQPRALTTVEIPKDAHDAVSRFAWLCNITRNRIKAMNGLGDDYFSNAQIALFYGSTDSNNKANFWFCFDWGMEGFHNTMGYELGEGLTVQDNDRLTFTSNQISGLKEWGNMRLADYEQDRAVELARLVGLTFTNECPDAYVKDSQVFRDGLYVSFKFN